MAKDYEETLCARLEVLAKELPAETQARQCVAQIKHSILPYHMLQLCPDTRISLRKFKSNEI